MNNPVLYIVVPCYNEEEVLPETSKRLKAKLSDLVAAGKVSEDSRVLFVDDGSKDRTWEMIRAYHEEDPRFSGVKLSRNRGHQNALLAGLMTAKDLADCTVSMDADLQDDINAIDGMVDKYLDEANVAGIKTVRLIHGKGTGALRQALQRFLRGDPRVGAFRLGRYGEGDSGVTVVELK